METMNKKDIQISTWWICKTLHRCCVSVQSKRLRMSTFSEPVTHYKFST